MDKTLVSLSFSLGLARSCRDSNELEHPPPLKGHFLLPQWFVWITDSSQYSDLQGPGSELESMTHAYTENVEWGHRLGKGEEKRTSWAQRYSAHEQDLPPAAELADAARPLDRTIDPRPGSSNRGVLYRRA